MGLNFKDVGWIFSCSLAKKIGYHTINIYKNSARIFKDREAMKTVNFPYLALPFGFYAGDHGWR